MLVTAVAVAISGTHGLTSNDAAQVLSGRNFTCALVEESMNGFVRLSSDASDAIAQIFRSTPLNSSYVVPARALTGMNVQVMEAMQNLVASKGYAPFNVKYVYIPQGQTLGDADVSQCLFTPRVTNHCWIPVWAAVQAVNMGTTITSSTHATLCECFQSGPCDGRDLDQLQAPSHMCELFMHVCYPQVLAAAMSLYKFDCIISGLQLLPQRMEVMDFMIPTVYSGYMVGGGLLGFWVPGGRQQTQDKAIASAG